jgi:hypothetical protein
MTEVGRVVAVLAGGWMVVWVLYSAVRSVVLPRGEPVLLTRLVFVPLRSLFLLRDRKARTYEDRDRALALYAPLGLLLMPGSWLAVVIAGFTAIFWGLGVDPPEAAFKLSGSSLLTLGFLAPPTLAAHVAAVVEAALGLGLVALLISYLPSIYSAFQRRELVVAQLATRAGDPPSAMMMLQRYNRLQGLPAIDENWEPWERWFSDVEETHTSQPSLVFFRSISHERSWITTAGVILDTASLRASTLDLPRSPAAELCIRAGYLCLRRVATYSDISFDSDPRPSGPVSIDRTEFDEAYDRLLADGLRLRADRDQCWNDFAGWRVNYDVPLLGLAGLIAAPYAPWTSDRSLRYRRPTITPFGRRRRHRTA